ncbi:hypothetical protein C8R47DRAFT_1076709 [Mycena vitilis]|nr:hypothetical protein C8R47DRAFT_1076709 [Mycena vitilis]
MQRQHRWLARTLNPSLLVHLPMRALWVSVQIVNVLLAAAIQTNHSIDDASPLVKYLPSDSMACIGCAGQTSFGLDTSKLHNGTFSFFNPAFSVPAALEMNFTGFALYIFLALSPGQPTGGLRFIMDGASVGIRANESSPGEARYNVSAYANTSLADGRHTFRMELLLPSDGAIFDYAVYTSSGSEPEPDPACPTVHACPTFCFESRRNCRRKRQRNIPAMGQSRVSTDTQAPPKEPAVLAPVAPAPSAPLEAPPTDQMASVATQEEVRILREQLEQLRQRVEGGSSATPTTGSETASLARSLSSMKREQTRALQAQRQGGDVTDNLVYTDSGLRLTVGRAVDEPPPSYVAD